MDRLFYRTNDNVSIHAPTRGATYLQTLLDLMIKVSIHAPTRGATYAFKRYIELAIVSIHAPTRGATIGCTTNG